MLIVNSVGLVEYRVVNRRVTYTCGKARVSAPIVDGFNRFSKVLCKFNFTNLDFRYLNTVDFKPLDFVYLDPPYIGTSQYKTKWSVQDEKDLYQLLDKLNDKGVRFALSNFKDGVNHTNNYLATWCSGYNIHDLVDNHCHANTISKMGERQEILITNY